MSKSTINRLSRYKSALFRLKSLGFVKVFSDNLADAVGVTPAQVRKDFSLFAISTGNKRGGYQIDALLESLNSILGTNKIQKVIIVGAGNIGTALMNYKGFEKESIEIVAAFDIDPSKYHKETKIPVLPLEELKDFIKNNNINIGIIAVPEIAAQQVLDILASAGIKGVLNFAPIRLRASDDIVINNINLASELENVVYYVHATEKTARNNYETKNP
ncbi:MAG: redox-sensing transcriptional repressor Rex [Candidatus Omnitrophota bacterium]|nr:MAG: redox-sensing transcriptional repressor Rex [Candidatus Omnitrophota bacterium]